MATTKARSTPSADGSAVQNAGARAKQAGDAVASVTRRARVPALAAGAAAAGLAGGLAIGSSMASKRGGLRSLLAPQRKVLGIPVGPKSGVVAAAEVLGKAAKELGAVTNRVSDSSDDVRQIREQLELANRRSPLEVVLDGLTHRRGAHKNER
jgi:hypothetical protein